MSLGIKALPIACGHILFPDRKVFRGNRLGEESVISFRRVQFRVNLSFIVEHLTEEDGPSSEEMPLSHSVTEGDG